MATSDPGLPVPDSQVWPWWEKVFQSHTIDFGPAGIEALGERDPWDFYLTLSGEDVL